MFDGLPSEQAERFDLFESVGQALLSHPWVFAKTMPENPHEYTLRKQWDPDAFDRAVLAIRQFGYKAVFKRRSYVQMDLNEHYYWTMGAPLPSTILINRKRRLPETHPASYDAAAPDYDDAFSSPECRRENETLFERLGDLSGLSVIDIGCGTGLTLDYATPAFYLGIDPSFAMLERLHAKHPASERVRTVYTKLAAFVGDRYDLALALFGAASYLNDGEIARIPSLLNPGGRAALMFYAPGYAPLTHTALGVSVPTFRHAPPSARPVRLGNYDLVEIRPA